MSNVKTAIKLFKILLENGQLDREEYSDLFVEYLNSEVKEVLSEFEEEMDCKIIKINDTIYLLPDYDNSLLGFKNKDFREWIGSNYRLSDVYLSYYITMFLLYKFYGGKNKNPKQREFMRINTLIDELDNRFEGILKQNRDEVISTEEKLSINLISIAESWNQKITLEDNKRTTKFGTVLRISTISLDKEDNKLKAEKENSLSQIMKLNENNNNILDQVTQLRAEEVQKRIDSNNSKNEIHKYCELENSLKEVFRRHAIDFNKRFNIEDNILFINNKINELQKVEREIEFNKKSINDKITSLKEGTYHVSNEFRQWLTNNSIDFETGENYLRNQEENIRNKLINQNPMLPYAFIMYEDDIKRIKSMNLDFNINQMIPILSYSHINESYAVNGKEVEISIKLHFICLYDSKMINTDNIESYMAQLNVELEDIIEKLNHYSNELKAARNDSYIIMQFNYGRNYIYELESKDKNLHEEIKKIQSNITEFENIKDNNSKSIEAYNTRIIKIDELLQKLENRKQIFIEFLEKDKAYLNNKILYKEYSCTINKVIDEKKIINEQKISLNITKDNLLLELQALGKKIIDNEKNYQLYKTAEEGFVEEDTIENMEERLHVLSSTIANDLGSLEKELNTKYQEINERNDNLKSFNLEEKAYVDVSFDKIKLQQLKKDENYLKNNKKEQDDICRKTESNLNHEQGKFAYVEKELYRITPSPIKPELIRLNFENRRKAENEKICNSNDSISKLYILTNEYKDITRNIENRIVINDFQVNTDYKIELSLKEDFKAINKELSNIHSENEKYEKNINYQYTKIKSEYKDKNKNIENIFIGLDPLVEGAADDKNKYYYLGERILYSSESLNKLIEACNLRLNNLEKNKKDMIQHSYLHGIQVYDEIQKIADNSSIQIDGKSKQMMKIEMIPLEEAADDNINKMKAYIESCVNMIKQDMKEDKKIEEIRKKISKYMSTRELLNVLSDLGKMVIKAYKIDINEKNSKYKTWEQVMKENSGGERFVSFFAVLIALMSYTRTSMKYTDDYERNKDTKVLIMDNPFGPISSEHLLKPLFSIAKNTIHSLYVSLI